MSKVLCVDLDGTLIHTDTLHELVLLFLKHNPFRAFLLPVWLLKGRAYLKQKLAAMVSLDASTLPYNQELLVWLKEEKKQGRKLVLVTAADQKIAHSIADYLGIFDEVLASDGINNLRSYQKASLLNKKYGEKNYDYVGNHRDDLAVWSNAFQSIVVNASDKVLAAAHKLENVVKTHPRRKLTLRSFLKAIRVHQYAKNILIFFPLLAAHLIFNIHILSLAILGFISFCLMASSVYLLNDLLDLAADRKHATKSKRALASGLLSIPKAIILIITFFIVALAIASLLPIAFISVLLIYYFLTLMYSFYLKKLVLIDVIMLSILYTIRILAGMTLLLSSVYSPWILIFSILLFLSLAFVKRVSELFLLKESGQHGIVGRAYFISDLHTFTVFGIASGFCAILVFFLYLNSDAALLLYKEPQALLALFPFMLYWLCRIWLLATQGKVHEDPVIFTVRDRTSYLIGIIMLIILVIATL